MNLRSASHLVATVAFALLLVYAGAFLVPHGASLGPFDRRALQHMVGFWGLAIILQGFVASFYSWSAYSVHAALFSCVAVASWFELFFPTALPLAKELRAFAAAIRNPGSVYLVGALIMAAYFRTDSRKLVVLGGLLFCLSISLCWELYLQPVVCVYDGPPRHTVQTPQVVADIVGIALAFATLWGITLRSTGTAQKAAQAG